MKSVRGVLIVAMSVYVINLSYLFEGRFTPSESSALAIAILEPLKDAPRVAPAARPRLLCRSRCVM